MTAPLSAPDARARQILNQAVLDVYRPRVWESATVPIDRRCPACGFSRDRCPSPTCIRGAA